MREPKQIGSSTVGESIFIDDGAGATMHDSGTLLSHRRRQLTKDNFGRSQVRVPGLIEGVEERRVLVVTTANKQGFTQV